MSLSLDQKRILAAALKREKSLKMDECIDPANLDSRPSPPQQCIIEDYERLHIYVVAGNQSFPEYQRVLMSDGSYKKIGDIVVGDLVYTFDTKLRKLVKSEVLKVWENGIKPVNRYRLGNNGFLDCTGKHEMLQYSGGGFRKKYIEDAPHVMYISDKIEGQDTVDSRKIELLGYLLGDGCLTKLDSSDLVKSGWARGIQFTNESESIWNHIESLLSDDFTWERYNNGDGYLVKKGRSNNRDEREEKYLLNEYVDFIRELGLDGKKAHEKFIPEVVFTQSIKTRQKFVAGLIETDGWIQNKTRIGFSTTSSDLAYGMQRLLSGLGIFSTINHRKRDNPNHNDEYTVQVSNAAHYNKFVTEIPMISKIGEIKESDVRYHPFRTQIKNDEIYLGDMPVYDLTVSHHDHNFICEGVVVGNSGKSQVGGRIVAWKFLDNHPYWNRRPEWGDEPLLIIVSGRLGDQVEELWEKKIRPFLPAGSYNKPQRSGPVLKSVTHKTNGNKIIFTSHDKANVSWEKIQSYVAHHIWIDEMPSHYKYLEEAHRRVDARQGQCMVTMTPKSKNEKIRQMVDNVDPRVGIKYMMGKLDNPIYKGREEIEIAKLATYSEEERNCILYGHWMQGEEAVFNFLRSDHVKELPPSYSCGWPHVLAFDPAGGGLGGLVIAARDPATHYWYIVKAQYIEGKAPSDLVDEVRNIAAPYNIVRKIYDTHENWFTSEAIKQGYGGWIAVEKHNRKKELITGLQQALLDKWLFCVPNLNKLYEEFRNAEWLDMDEMKIRNSSKYHLLDAIQYMVDNLPRVAEERVNLTRDQAIIKAHEETLAAEAAAKKAKIAESHRKQFKVGSPRFRRKRW